MKRPRIIILSSQEDYWEALYIDGNCVGQAHHLGEGNGKLNFLKNLVEKYDFQLNDVVEIGAEEVDDENAMNCGCFPDNFDELQGDYEF